ncbi:MAG: hypothetical protein GX767_03840 [Firmicutes bacterium]|nr:hypothetical protein [Bacillota bacterium]
MAGIKDIAVYIPAKRIKTGEIRDTLGQFANHGIKEKAVASFDEDSFTMAVEAGNRLLGKHHLPPASISFLAVASTSLPYSEKSSAASFLLALGLPQNILAMEFTNSPRAATTALLAANFYLNSSEQNTYALVISAELPLGRARNDLAHRAGAAAAAVLLSRSEYCLEIKDFSSYHDEFPGLSFKSYSEREKSDLGIQSYSEKAFKEVTGKALRQLLDKTSSSLGDYAFIALPQPDARLPLLLARSLKLPREQYEKALTAPLLGELGCSSPFVSLHQLFDEVKKGDNILLLAYGSGSGCDAVALKVEEPPIRDDSYREPTPEYISFIEYLKERQLL